MYKSKEISRRLWSSDGRYLVMAHAKFRERMAACGVHVAIAVVHIFEGDPVLTDASAIFYSFSQLHSGDLLDEVQNAERIGRDFFASTRI